MNSKNYIPNTPNKESAASRKRQLQLSKNLKLSV
jgi:hypothetical protein